MHTDECLTMKSWHQSRIATSRVPSLLIVSKSPVRSTQQGAKTEIAEGRNQDFDENQSGYNRAGEQTPVACYLACRVVVSLCHIGLFVVELRNGTSNFPRNVSRINTARRERLP